MTHSSPYAFCWWRLYQPSFVINFFCHLLVCCYFVRANAGISPFVYLFFFLYVSLTGVCVCVWLCMLQISPIPSNLVSSRRDRCSNVAESIECRNFSKLLLLLCFSCFFSLEIFGCCFFSAFEHTRNRIFLVFQSRFTHFLSQTLCFMFLLLVNVVVVVFIELR